MPARIDCIKIWACRWFVYCEVHRLLPLDYRVFTPILEKLRKRIQGEEQEQCKEFHQAADNFATR